MFRHWQLGMALLAAFWAAIVFAAAEKERYEPKLVKLSELIKEIQSHKGKVVVMDVWNDG